ncbi:MAG: UbiA family prenyltransferase [Planctomycetota bacterium]|jgi:geranylgeranylglycerol-phosphate geranylgeranyltransferase
MIALAGKTKDVLRLCRLYYTLPFPAAYLLTVWYARGGEMAGQWTGAILSAVALALVMAFAYVFNDVCDVAVDQVNAPARPVAAGRLSRWEAAAWAMGFLGVGLVLAGMCRPAFFAALAAVAAGLAIYDVLSKRLGMFKQVAVAALTACIYPLAFAQAGGVVGARAATLAVFPAWLFLTAFGYEFLKDLRDSAGDHEVAGAGRHLRRNPGLWRNIASVAIVLGAALLVGPWLLGCRWVYMLFAAGAMAAAVSSVFLPERKALAVVYVECSLVGLGAVADVMVFGP